MSDAAKKKVLFSWFGESDVCNTNKNKKLSGALGSAIDFLNPDKLFLLNGLDYEKKPDKYDEARSGEEQVESFVKILKDSYEGCVVIQRVEEMNPIDYQEICAALIPFLTKHYQKEADTYFLQTSGTPSMAVTWALLSQNRFPAQLLQTSEGKPAELINLPFRVVTDFIPSEKEAAVHALLSDVEGGEILYSGEPMESLLRRADRVALHDVPVLILGELPPDCQTKLLRALESGTVTKVGSHEEEHVDIRIVAATHRDLQVDVAEGRFREDLFYRLAVGVLKIPPLSERKGDAQLIAKKLLARINEQAKKTIGDNYAVKKFDNSANKFITRARWKGNVRELNNTLRRICIWKDEAVITAEDIESELIEIPESTLDQNILERPFTEGFTMESIVREVEKHYVDRAIKETSGNKSKAARLMGISRPTLDKKL